MKEYIKYAKDICMMSIKTEEAAYNTSIIDAVTDIVITGSLVRRKFVVSICCTYNNLEKPDMIRKVTIEDSNLLFALSDAVSEFVGKRNVFITSAIESEI